MTPRTECHALRPSIFALLEDEVPERERSRLTAHLVTCEACRSEMLAERSLTELLKGTGTRPASRTGRGSRPRLSRVAAIAAVALLLLGVWAAWPATRVYGAITPRRLDVTMSWQSGKVQALAASNHIEVPAGEARSIDVPGAASLRVIGPALFELELATEMKLVVLRGQLGVTIDPAARMQVITPRGSEVLAGGSHFVRASRAVQSDDSPAELYQAGIDAFFEKKDMKQAEGMLRKALEHEDLDRELRSQVLFYLAAAVGNGGDSEEALALSRKWLEENPEDPSRTYVRLFTGVYLQRLGRVAEAETVLRGLIEESPDHPLADHARMLLSQPSKSTVEAESQPALSEIERSLPSVLPEQDAYVVVEVVGGSMKEAIASVSKQVAEFHEARRLAIPVTELRVTEDFERLVRQLRDLKAREVLVVVAPELLDVNFHRQLLLASIGLDSDPLPDLSLGYLTARTGESLERLWQRIAALHRDGIDGRRWHQTAVSGGIASTRYAGDICVAAKAAGFQGDQDYFGSVDVDPEVLDYVDRHLKDLESADVIQVFGNGDPQGIWLFSDRRNLERDRHWTFDPKKVGLDPKGEMPRILARHVRGLELDSPLVWSGTCHSAAVSNVYVENDIISTFGRTDRVTRYRLDPMESLALAWIDAGAAALMAPIAANHGQSVSQEADFCVSQGASLGETLKATYDDVCLAAGSLRLEIVHEGDPHVPGAEDVMQGGGANRILIGDPALRPFPGAALPHESVEIARRGARGLDVVVKWEKGWHARAWDMYGTDSAHDWRIGARIELGAVLPEEWPSQVTTRVQVTGEDGESLPFSITRAEPEMFGGKLYLHLQANADRSLVQQRFARAVFSITWE